MESADVAGVTGERTPGAGLAPEWWAPALALHERTGQQVPRTLAPDTRLDAWRAAHGAGLATRLAGLGLDEPALLGLLAEAPAHLAARVRRPSWVAAVEQALDRVTPTDEVPSSWHDAFAVPLRALVAGAAESLVEHASRLLTPHETDLAAVAGSFSTWLSRRLVATAARTFVAHLHELRAGGRLRGADARERFDDFVRQLAEPEEQAALFTRYPVLARLLAQTCELATAAGRELFTRFAADRAEVVATLLAGVDPGPVVAVASGLGDLHQGGRSVATLRFADGRLVVYRPRDVRVYPWLSTVVAWLNEAVPELGIRTVDVLARDGYGWLEHIPHESMTDRREVDRFYRRLGASLALVHALDGTDMHCENLIACGDQPVLVDVETLFHPPLTDTPPDDPAARVLASSVHRTALLPFPVVGENGVRDLSGVGGGPGGTTAENVVDWDFAGTDRMRLVRRPKRFAGARNRPRLDGQDIDLVDHEPVLREGFRLAYDAIMARREEFAGLLDCGAGCETRVVVRPTREYATLLDESTHPALLRDALDRDLALGALCQSPGPDPSWHGLAGHELADLWAGDVPLFRTRPGTRELWSATGERLGELFDTTGVSRVRRKLDEMCGADRRDQEWIISAALATQRPTGPGPHQDREPIAVPVTGTVAHPQRLLTTACAIADRIVAMSMVGDGVPGRVNWLGLELVDQRQWVVLPKGAGLANGYLGVALFLAQLGQVSGVSRYADTARTAIAGVPALLGNLDGNPDLVAAIGPGGLYGLGGVAYGLSRLATLLDDPEVRQWARAAVDLAATAPPRPGWADGSAGCLAAMTAIHAEHGFPEARRLAATCAEHTAELVSRAPADLTGGFADGWAGVAWALAGHAPAHTAAAGQARARVTPADSPGWCHGAAGTLLARTSSRRVAPERVVAALTDRPVLRDLTLCHGELGVAEVLTVLAGTTGSQPLALAARQRAGLVLSAIDRFGPTCGTPGRVPTPGLLSGLAGIGYGLLRLGFANRVPSVLLLHPEPGPTGKQPEGE